MLYPQSPLQQKILHHIVNYELPILKNRYVIQFLLALFIVAYTGYFSWYTINRHNTLNSYAADLSLIDQPMWNTVRGPGGFMELTWGNQQQPRLAEHFEPILIPLALLFYIWDDVRILLIAQSFALAIGAVPVFWIARKQLPITNYQLPITNYQLPITNVQLSNPQYPKDASSPISNLQPFDFAPFNSIQDRQDRSPISTWLALAFSLVYLLYPHLQAANIADFHADPFVVAPLLFAFWYATERRWLWMWVWAIIAMLTKENLPTLTAVLGVWFSVRSVVSGQRSALWHGLALILVSAAWFLIATFFIVGPLAREYFGTDGPIYFANRFGSEAINPLQMLTDPARWHYLLGLFAAVGFLPLLAPELLLLGLPVLLANLLSNFPGQYSGEQHYSAPLVAAFIVAAIYGMRRILIWGKSLREANDLSGQKTALLAALLWLLAWSFGYHAMRGWTPFAIRTETYRSTEATTYLPQLLEQIPADAVVTASAGIHPHVAHRRVAYVFPTVENAGTLLVDVTDIPGAHPYDVHAQIMTLLNNNWQLIDAHYGLIFARRSSQAATHVANLPNEFYTFVQSAKAPTYPTHLTFGDDQLRLLGYDVVDDPDDGTIFRFHWQTDNTLPNNLKLWPLIYDDNGQLLSDPTQVPMIAAVWYPPDKWQPGSVIITETLPQLLPSTFHLGLAVGDSTDSFYDSSRRWPINKGKGASARLYAGRWVQLASFTQQGPFLTHLPPQPRMQSFTPLTVEFESAIQLKGFRLDNQTLRPNSNLNILLQWSASQLQQTDFTVFVHLLDADKQAVTQNDAFPTWLMPQPTSQWETHQPIPDRHVLTLPADLSPGTYTVQVGLYNAQTLERLPLVSGGDSVQLTQIEIQ